MVPKVGFMCIDRGYERNGLEIWAIFQILIE